MGSTRLIISDPPKYFPISHTGAYDAPPNPLVGWGGDTLSPFPTLLVVFDVSLAFTVQNAPNLKFLTTHVPNVQNGFQNLQIWHLDPSPPSPGGILSSSRLDMYKIYIYMYTAYKISS